MTFAQNKKVIYFFTQKTKMNAQNAAENISANVKILSRRKKIIIHIMIFIIILKNKQKYTLLN